MTHNRSCTRTAPLPRAARVLGNALWAFTVAGSTLYLAAEAARLWGAG